MSVDATIRRLFEVTVSSQVRFIVAATDAAQARDVAGDFVDLVETGDHDIEVEGEVKSAGFYATHPVYGLENTDGSTTVAEFFAGLGGVDGQQRTREGAFCEGRDARRRSQSRDSSMWHLGADRDSVVIRAARAAFELGWDTENAKRERMLGVG